MKIQALYLASFSSIFQVCASATCATLYDNGDFTDDDSVDVMAGVHVADFVTEKREDYDKQTSAVKVYDIL